MLSDGHLFTVVDHPRLASDWIEIFVRASIEVQADTLGTRFLCLSGVRR